MKQSRGTSDRPLIVVLLAPLVLAGLFAIYRLATRTPPPPAPSVEEQLRAAAVLFAETRLGRPLTEEERALVLVERDEQGNWRASYNEPLHSRIPGPATGPTGPATRP